MCQRPLAARIRQGLDLLAITRKPVVMVCAQSGSLHNHLVGQKQQANGGWRILRSSPVDGEHGCDSGRPRVWKKCHGCRHVVNAVPTPWPLLNTGGGQLSGGIGPLPVTPQKKICKGQNRRGTLFPFSNTHTSPGTVQCLDSRLRAQTGLLA